MRKFLFMVIAIFALTSCGPKMYSTRQVGKDNVSYVIVLTAGQKYTNVVVEIDGQAYPVEKVYKEKAARKALQIIIEPGKHNVKVISNGQIITNEDIFIALQETKKIVLQ